MDKIIHPFHGRTLTDGQRDCLSAEAIDALSTFPRLPFANLAAPYITSPQQIHNFREGNLKDETPKEDAIIARFKLSVRKIQVAGVDVVVIEPETIAPRDEGKIVLSIHGGAFVMMTGRDRSALLMAKEMGMRVYSVQYQLSPEVRYPVARDQCFEVYAQLVQDVGAANIFCSSVSAGSQLMLSTLLVAKQHNLAMPAACYLSAPACDLHGSGDSFVTNANDRDILPASFYIEMTRQNYKNPDVDDKDPLYSPLYAEYDDGFPACVITTGTRDALHSSAIMLFWKLKEAGVKVELLVQEGLWHGSDFECDLPEAVRIRKVVARFLRAADASSE